jgi:tetraspanin-5
VSQQYDVAKIINENGCIQAGEEWLERNLLVVAEIAVAAVFLQVRTNHACQ